MKIITLFLLFFFSSAYGIENNLLYKVVKTKGSKVLLSGDSESITEGDLLLHVKEIIENQDEWDDGDESSETVLKIYRIKKKKIFAKLLKGSEVSPGQVFTLQEKRPPSEFHVGINLTYIGATSFSTKNNDVGSTIDIDADPSVGLHLELLRRQAEFWTWSLIVGMTWGDALIKNITNPSTSTSLSNIAADGRFIDIGFRAYRHLNEKFTVGGGLYYSGFTAEVDASSTLEERVTMNGIGLEIMGGYHHRFKDSNLQLNIIPSFKVLFANSIIYSQNDNPIIENDASSTIKTMNIMIGLSYFTK